ncbi:hypothetical protein GJ744_005670 [Endocarpon pusillum]|uniref:PiggyBac transposable element-derived protein domain-containing protein n=1 Tax=Endocarpon pusillum TaxID=364733 RepID=A0A8H7DYA0_9EURO|nr:hypothetical protein GJ744_005670 [Endocarpon pusillum]
MLRPRRDTQIPLRYGDNSPPQLLQSNNQRKRCRTDPENVDRNNVDQALAVIAPASECADELPTLISTELPQFDANYVENRAGAPRYTVLSALGFFTLFFSDLVVEILSKETNSYAEYHLRYPSFPPLSLPSNCHWIPTTPAEIRVFLGIHLYFGLYILAVRTDYWKIHNLGQFMSRDRFELIHRYFSTNSASPPPNCQQEAEFSATATVRLSATALLLRNAYTHSNVS